MIQNKLISFFVWPFTWIYHHLIIRRGNQHLYKDVDSVPITFTTTVIISSFFQQHLNSHLTGNSTVTRKNINQSKRWQSGCSSAQRKTVDKQLLEDMSCKVEGYDLDAKETTFHNACGNDTKHVSQTQANPFLCDNVYRSFKLAFETRGFYFLWAYVTIWRFKYFVEMSLSIGLVVYHHSSVV